MLCLPRQRHTRHVQCGADGRPWRLLRYTPWHELGYNLAQPCLLDVEGSATVPAHLYAKDGLICRSFTLNEEFPSHVPVCLEKDGHSISQFKFLVTFLYICQHKFFPLNYRQYQTASQARDEDWMAADVLSVTAFFGS